MSKPNTSPPKPPPFPVGARVRYTGARRVWYGAVANPRPLDEHPEDWTEIAAGFEAVIVRVREGTRGTGRHLRDEDGPMFDDDGNPCLDETRDGWSVYEIPGPRKPHGRCIDTRNAGEWVAVAKPVRATHR